MAWGSGIPTPACPQHCAIMDTFSAYEQRLDFAYRPWSFLTKTHQPVISYHHVFLIQSVHSLIPSLFLVTSVLLPLTVTAGTVKQVKYLAFLSSIFVWKCLWCLTFTLNSPASLQCVYNPNSLLSRWCARIHMFTSYKHTASTRCISISTAKKAHYRSIHNHRSQWSTNCSLQGLSYIAYHKPT